MRGDLLALPFDDATFGAVTVGWGHAGQGGVTMPGAGRLVRRAGGNWGLLIHAKNSSIGQEAAARAVAMPTKVNRITA